MKKLLQFAFILFFGVLYGQHNLDLDLKDKYQDAVLTFNDGSIRTGEVYGIIDSKSASVYASDGENFDLSQKKITFKNQNGKKEKIESDDLKAITIGKNNNTLTLLYLGIKNAKEKGKIKDTDQKMWLPIVVEDPRISILGYNLFTAINENTFPSSRMVSFFYFQRKGENFIIDPFSLSILDIFRLRKKATNNMKTALKEVFRDCPEMMKYIDEEFDNFSREERKRVRKGFRKKRKEAHQKIQELPEEEQGNAWVKAYQDVYLEPYVMLLDKYNESCPQ